MRVVVLVLAGLSARAVADPCKDDKPWLRKVTSELQQLAEHSEDAALKCGLHGADDKQLERLIAEVKRVMKDLRAIPNGTCKLNEAGATTRDLAIHLGDWTTEQLARGMAWCSTKIRAHMTEMKKAGKTQAEIDSETRQLAITMMSEGAK